MSLIFVTTPDLMTMSSGHTTVWKVAGNTAYNFHLNRTATINDKEDALSAICDALGADVSRASIMPVRLSPGMYYPRMARPYFGDSTKWETYLGGADDGDRIQSRKQLEIFMGQLERICRTVQPDTNNLSTYGHDIRNLLILVCTEIESQWKGTLRANHYPEGCRRWSTNDYSRLKPAMRLDEYVVKFTEFPTLQAFKPFDDWDRGDSTNSIGWYSAYNAVKHDGQKDFYLATLENLFQAVAACVIMLVSQYGRHVLINTTLAYLIQITWPGWLVEEMYLGNLEAAVEQLAIDHSLP